MAADDADVEDEFNVSFSDFIAGEEVFLPLRLPLALVVLAVELVSSRKCWAVAKSV